MTVPVTSRVQTYPAASGSGPFSFTFPVLLSNSLVPYIKVEKVLITTGARTTLAYPGDFAFVAVGGGAGGGTVAPTVALTGDSNLVITGLTTVSQEVSYRNEGDFFPEKHERSYDKLTMIAQEQSSSISRSLKLAPESAFSGELYLGELTANTCLMVNSTATRIIMGPSLSDISNVAATAAAAAASAAAASASETAAAASAATAAAAAAGMKYRNVRVATTANGTLATAFENGDTVDGVVLVTGNRILLKDQSAPAENGIYTVNASGAPTRASDMDTWTEVVGTVVVVTEGTVNDNTVWLCTSNDGGTLNTTAITFVDWGSTIVNGSITLAKMATQAANTIVANATGSTASPTAVAIAANQFLARSSAGNLTAVTITDFAFSLIDDTTASAALTTLGVSTFIKTLLDDADAAAARITLGVGPTLGTPVAATSGTSIDFLGIPANTKRVTINFTGVSTNGSDDIIVQLGDSGGIEASGYLGASMFANGATPVIDNFTSGFGIRAQSATAVRHGSIILTLANSSTNTWIANGNIGLSDSTGMISTAGSKSTSAVLDRVRITTVSGINTFDAGEINISYE